MPGSRKPDSYLLEKRPAALVVASAVGYYGDRGDQELVESSEPALTFLAEVCMAWEVEASKAAKLVIRVGRRPALLLVSRFGLRAALGEMSQILMVSQRVLAQVALDTGYRFLFEDLRPALDSCLGKGAVTKQK